MNCYTGHALLLNKVFKIKTTDPKGQYHLMDTSLEECISEVVFERQRLLGDYGRRPGCSSGQRLDQKDPAPLQGWSAAARRERVARE